MDIDRDQMGHAEHHITIDDLLNRAKGYLPARQLPVIREAYAFAAKAHEGHTRPNGDPYITHALSVAQILAAMRLDADTIISGLFHGILKEPHSGVDEALIRKKFGKDVAHIVSGATKISDVQYNSKIAYQAENIRKMLLAMSADIRVLLVKLADRLNDMQILDFPPDQQKEFAQETLDLYAPLASRLGIDWMKRELEDRAFSVLHPQEYKELESRVNSSLGDREKYVADIKKLLTKKLKEQGISSFKILGRPKHLLSIYQKLLVQKITLDKVYDKVAFRIILGTVRECYQALGLVHSLWTPIDHRIKDYISQPKSNRYQSLHTSVIGPAGEFMEIQIRTAEMDKIAKEGIAAHWAYKEGAAISEADASTFQWLKQLVNWLQELKDPKEFLDTVKNELAQAKKIYVLTPNGEVKELPAGATPLDFAYAIHTEVGNRCTGARINGTMVSLKTELKNGNAVEIITSQKQHPHQGWLNLVKTGRAKSRIRHWLRQDEQAKSLRIGEEICERELKKHALSLKKLVKSGDLKSILKKVHCNSLQELLIRVGSGKVTTRQLATILFPEQTEAEKETPQGQEIPLPRTSAGTDSDDAITIDGIPDMMIRISQCCMPMPGEEIMGFITAGRGISVHKESCPNLLNTDPQRWLKVRWNETKTSHRTQIHVIAQDHKGLLAELCNALSDGNANILNIDAHSSKDRVAHLNLIIEVSSLDHLSSTLQRLRQVAGVMEAKRQ
ncbi:MAG: bifunctional (p)ppGpp synthetase/guanosine-3',5'-bis(diphosphate) 3'-pyrophosphohydrolase [Desulfurivibrionaceae bacterium]|nr:bifunctional (p)ppGpp synthetase/guanosine-3',5'-bis(diphosphate) 3'-pyrophosphohydrolase [Desulfurivibrionaceae bacterium]